MVFEFPGTKFSNFEFTDSCELGSGTQSVQGVFRHLLLLLLLLFFNTTGKQSDQLVLDTEEGERETVCKHTCNASFSLHNKPSA